MSSPIEALRRRLLLLLTALLALTTITITNRQLLASLLSAFEAQLAVLAIFVLFLISRSANKRNLSGNAPPKVKGWLPGNIDVLWKLVQGESTEYCASILREWEAQYGPTYDMNILWSHQIVTSDPTNVKEILATKFGEFEKSKRFRDMLVSFLGDAIFTSDGEDWKRHRAIARPFFARDRTSDFELFERHSHTLLERLDGASGFLDIQNLFGCFTIDSIAEFLLGVRLNTLDGKWSDTKNSLSDFVHAFEDLQRIAMTRVRIGSNWPLFELFGDTSLRPAAILNRFVEPIVQKAFDERSTEAGASGTADQTYLQFLVNEVNDPKSVRDSVVSLLLAGRDTTASLLSFATYSLSIYPLVARRLRQEVLSVIGTSSSTPITPDDLKQLRYLRAFLNETLRLFPPVPLNIRRAVSDTTLSSPLSNSGPFVIRKNQSVTYAPILTQRRRDIWGEDADEFKPERWLASPSDANTGAGEDESPNSHLRALTHVLNPFSFTPFNAGPRICLGQSFALNEVSYTLVRLLQRFEGFELDPGQKIAMRKEEGRGREGTERCWPRASLTLYVEGGLRVRPIPAKDDSSM